MTRRRLPTQTGKECQPKGLAPFPTSSPRARWRLSARPRRARIKSRGGRRKAPPSHLLSVQIVHNGHFGRSRNSTFPCYVLFRLTVFFILFRTIATMFSTPSSKSGFFCPGKFSTGFPQVFQHQNTEFSTSKTGVFHSNFFQLWKTFLKASNARARA